jgi:predicted AAA+ superfamily ATPase
MRIQRLNKIKYYINNNKSCLILGPRGTGKSYYLNELLATENNIFRINLLNNLEFRKYFPTPELLYDEVQENLKTYSRLIIYIDEIQKIPQLFDECHRALEKFSDQVIFILTGSSARKLKRNKANLLAARALLVSFSSLSYNEINFPENEKKIVQYGLLPMAFIEQKEEFVQDYLKTYVATYLKEEIIDEALTRKVEVFNLFLELAAQYNGQPLNFSKIAKQLKIDVRVLKTHYEILEDTMIIHTVAAWSNSVKKRLLLSSKHFFFDNGILNALRLELKTEIKASTIRYGFLFENLLVNEVIKINQRLGDEFKIFHYRTETGQEVDLILQKNSFATPIAVEIKTNEKPTIDDLAGLQAFKSEFPEAKLYCVCRASRPYSLGDILVVPYNDFLLQLEAEKIVT